MPKRQALFIMAFGRAVGHEVPLSKRCLLRSFCSWSARSILGHPRRGPCLLYDFPVGLVIRPVAAATVVRGNQGQCSRTHHAAQAAAGGDSEKLMVSIISCASWRN